MGLGYRTKCCSACPCGRDRQGAEVGQKTKEASQAHPGRPRRKKNPAIHLEGFSRRMEKTGGLPCSPGLALRSFQLLCALPRSLTQCHKSDSCSSQHRSSNLQGLAILKRKCFWVLAASPLWHPSQQTPERAKNRVQIGAVCQC